MKQIKYLAFLILASCITEAPIYPRRYIIENGTGIPITLQFYSEGTLTFRYGETQLQNTEQLVGVTLDRRMPWSEFSPDTIADSPVSSFQADSIRIIYDNLKVSSFTYTYRTGNFTPIERNILRDSDYTSIGGDNFLFIINESDFENAEDCNGNCE
jgi:hypothetical protein